MSYYNIVRVPLPRPLHTFSDCPDEEGIPFHIVDIDIRKAMTAIQETTNAFFFDFGKCPTVTVVSREVMSALRYVRVPCDSYYMGTLHESPTLSMYDVRCF